MAVAGCDGFLRFVSVADGKQSDPVEIGGNIASTPAVVGSRLFFGTMNESVVGVDWKKKRSFGNTAITIGASPFTPPRPCMKISLLSGDGINRCTLFHNPTGANAGFIRRRPASKAQPLSWEIVCMSALMMGMFMV